MKCKVIFVIIFFNAINLFCQSQIIENHSLKNKDIVSPVFQLFPTQNIWTFLKLNTMNGKIWQVQFATNDKNRFESILNTISLVDFDDELIGRFVLYPTQNMWSFILLDQISGKTWQVQWSADIENRQIIPIN